MPAIRRTRSERKVTTDVMGSKRVDKRDKAGTICEGKERMMMRGEKTGEKEMREGDGGR